MIAVDTNVLVYAHRQESPQHDRALREVRGLAEGGDLWAIPVFVLGEFLRVVTHPRIFSPPTSREVAVSALENLLRSPSVRVLYPGSRYWTLLQTALEDADGRGNLVLDAEIVAVCRENGVREILTEDRDFQRFTDVRSHRLPADGDVH